MIEIQVSINKYDPNGKFMFCYTDVVINEKDIHEIALIKFHKEHAPQKHTGATYKAVSHNIEVHIDNPIK